MVECTQITTMGKCRTRGAALLLVFALAFLVCLALVPADEGASPVQSAQAATSIASSKVKVTGVSKTYFHTGKTIKPRPVVSYRGKTLKNKRDYRLVYSENKNVGTATLTIQGIGSFKKTRTLHFKIAYNFSKNGKAKLSYKAYYYTGKAVKPAVKVTYRSKQLASSYYKVSYSNNVKKGTATVTVKGRRGYKGTLTRTFTIAKNLKDNVTVKLSRSTFAYTGTARKPIPTLTYGSQKLVSGTDYSYSYKNNKKVGTATISFTGKNGYHFSLSKTFTIKKDGGKVIDVSEHDGTISWSKVKPKIDAAILRSYVMFSAHKKYRDSTTHRIDNYYSSYAESCTGLDIPFGSYGFVVFMSKKDAVKQATEFFNCAVYGNVKGTGSVKYRPNFLALDLEAANMKTKGTNVQEYTSAAIDTIQTLAKKAGYANGIKVGLYIGNDVYSTFGFTSTAGAKVIADQFDFVWIPTYGKNTGKVPTKYSPSYAYDMWQYTSRGGVSGISGDVDVSLVDSSGPKGHNMGWYLKR